MVNILRAILLFSSFLSFCPLARAQTVVTSSFDLRPSGSRSQQVVGLGDTKSQVI